MSKREMGEEIRKTGIDVIGDAPWGTHFCQFYKTREDLIDVLVPYFKAGLENNEFCMWVTSEPLSEEEAKKAMIKAVPNFDRYLKRGQIEIIPHTKWYLKDGDFNLQKVLNAWIDRLNQALAKGYDGIRVTGNTAWLEKRDWKDFADYEEEVNRVIGKYRMMAICTYSLDRCGASEVIDVVRNHQFAFIKRRGEWELIESSELKGTKDALRESEEEYRNLLENARDTIMTLDLNGNITFVNRVVEEYGFKKEEVVGKSMAEFVPEKSLPILIKEFAKVIRGKPAEGEIEIITPKGKILSEYRSSPIRRGNKVIGSQTILRDITERKQSEQKLRQSEEKYRLLVENVPVVAATLDREDNTIVISSNVEKMLGFTPQEIYQAGNRFWNQRIHPDDRERVREAYDLLFTRNKMFDFEYRIQRKDGRWIWVHDRAVATRKKDGETCADGVLIDITERKRAEDALRESEEKFRNIFESAGDAMIYLDRSGRILDVNEKAVEVFGGSRKEMLGKHFTRVGVFSLRDMPALMSSFANILAGKKATLNLCIKNKKGREIPLECSASFMKTDDKLAGAMVIARDVTERKNAEKKIRESEEKFRNIFEGVNDEILYVDKYGKIVDVNKRVEDIFGYKRDEVIGKNFARLGALKPKDLLIIPKLFADAMRGGVVYPLMEFELKDKKGNKVPVETSTRLIKKDGKIEGLLVIVRDVRERKQMQEKLRQYSEHLEELVQKRTEELLESEKRCSVLVEEARDGVAIIQDGKIVFANKRGPELIGYSIDELIGLPFVKIVDEKYRQLTKERYERRLQGERIPPTYEIEVISKTGERVPVELSATSINYQGRPADLIIVRDIRERKRIEEERLKLEKLATIGELATMVGHDLRNPLQSIENAVYCLNNVISQCSPTHYVSIPQKAGEMLEVINDSVNYADKIIADLQDFSATRKPILKKTNLNTIVKETLTQVETPENVKLITELRHLPEIEADKDMIKRISMNLATNGIQAMKNGGKLKVSTKKTKGFVEVSFKDTGTGISKENMKKLFTPFFTTKAKGMGMGLAICKKFIEAHGGTIEVESKEGKGSTFTVKLHIK